MDRQESNWNDQKRKVVLPPGEGSLFWPQITNLFYLPRKNKDEKGIGIVARPGTAGFVILATDLWRRVVRNQLALLVATVLAGVVPTVHR